MRVRVIGGNKSNREYGSVMDINVRSNGDAVLRFTSHKKTLTDDDYMSLRIRD